MEVSSKHQLYVFVLCIMAGIVCGVFFDTQRSIRKLVAAGKIRTMLEDFLFAFVCLGIMTVSGYFFNKGQMRYYQILGVLSGALFYAAFMSRITMKLLKAIYVIVRKYIAAPCVKIFKILTYPLLKTVLFLHRKIQKTGHFTKRISSAVKSRAKRLKKRMKML